jgi:hypothetical protein
MSDMPSPVALSRLLAAEAAAVAESLAAVIRETASGVEGAEACADLLEDWAGVTSAYVSPADPLRIGPVQGMAARLGLSDAERDLVLLAGLPEEHECLAAVMRAINPRREPTMTVGIAARVVGDRELVNEVLASGRAVRLGLLSLGTVGPFPERSIGVAEGVWWALHGFEAWPAGLRRVQLPADVPGLERWTQQADVQRTASRLAAKETVVVTLDTSDLTIALSRCAGLGSVANVQFVAARVQASDWSSAALACLHAAARDAVGVLIVESNQVGGPPSVLDLDGLPDGPLVVCTPPGIVSVTTTRPVDAPPLGPVEAQDRRTAWERVLPGRPELAPALAARHPIDPAHAALIGQDLGGRAQSEGSVAAAIQRRAGLALPAGADVVEPSASWHRLILDEDSDEQLRHTVARVHHQATVLDDWGMLQAARASRGVRLIFTGPPGTGKSLAAEVLAGALETALLVVDVSRVVSKWLGETEKNLAGVFDAAEASQSLLLLDEADAIFGRRTAIGEARDRYANIETAYLLQRVERFSGVVVLTTNLLQNIDPAFLRRVDFVIDFRLPDTIARVRMWDIHVPKRLREDNVDLHSLASAYPVPGAWIRGAAISAAYAAAQHHTLITQDQLIAGMRREYAKAHKPCPERPSMRPGVLDARAARTLLTAAAGSHHKEST